MNIAYRLKMARYPVPEECHSVVLAALAKAHIQRPRKAILPHRVPLIAACAFVLVGALLAVPGVRLRAANGVLTLLGRFVAPQSDLTNPQSAAPGVALASRTVTSAPSPTPTFHSFFADVEDDQYPGKFALVAQNSAAVEASDTQGGIKLRVLEGAIAGERQRLFLVMGYTGLPEHCFPEEQIYTITINGTELPISSTQTGTDDRMVLETELPGALQNPTGTLNVSVETTVRQFPDSGEGHGEKLADFAVDFTLPAPVTVIALPDDVMKELDKNDSPLGTPTPSAEAMATGGAETTTAPTPSGADASADATPKPQDVNTLSEPEGIDEWTTIENKALGLSFEIPKEWDSTDGDATFEKLIAHMDHMDVKGVALNTYAGNGGTIYLGGLQFYGDKGSKTYNTLSSDLVSLLFDSASRSHFEVDKWSIEYLEGTQVDAATAGGPMAAIVFPTNGDVELNGQLCDHILIVAPADIAHHILKTLSIDQ